MQRGGETTASVLTPVLLLASAAALLAPATTGCRTDARVAAPLAEASPSDQSAGACGRPPLRPCPLQQWMGTTLTPALRDGPVKRLVTPLQRLAALAPTEFPRWRMLALAGATAAAADDQSGVRASCGGCHDAYRARYRAEMRARPLGAPGAESVQ